MPFFWFLFLGKQEKGLRCRAQIPAGCLLDKTPAPPGKESDVFAVLAHHPRAPQIEHFVRPIAQFVQQVIGVLPQGGRG